MVLHRHFVEYAVMSWHGVSRRRLARCLTSLAFVLFASLKELGTLPMLLTGHRIVCCRQNAARRSASRALVVHAFMSSLLVLFHAVSSSL